MMVCYIYTEAANVVHNFSIKFGILLGFEPMIEARSETAQKK